MCVQYADFGSVKFVNAPLYATRLIIPSQQVYRYLLKYVIATESLLSPIADDSDTSSDVLLRVQANRGLDLAFVKQAVACLLKRLLCNVSSFLCYHK